MPETANPEKTRQFAVRIVHKLRHAGYEALFAGGCVRDQLLGMLPSDFDVATNATPDEVRACFGQRRTLAIGAAFGVITVLGSKSEGQVEVATFRSDASYSDGRHPDHVSFSTAREDAERRDFTINGLFYDPVADSVIDYVGGLQDLRAGIVRAIGDPFARFAEDKLRMLRAVRFTATFEFQLDPDTLNAVKQEAHKVTVVSAERIAMEMRKIMVHPRRAPAARLLRESGLLEAILPESQALLAGDSTVNSERLSLAEEPAAWRDTLGILQGLDTPTFRVALAALLWGIRAACAPGDKTVQRICHRWRLSNYETDGTQWLLAHEATVRRASTVAWPKLQRILIHEDVPELLTLAEAVARQVDGSVEQVEFCRDKLRQSLHDLNPPMLITGNDLREAGLESGPLFRVILERVRDAQLNAEIQTRDQALQLARRIAQGDSTDWEMPKG